jgi:hypothetical protein
LSGIRPVERSIHPSPFYCRCLSIASRTDLPGPFRNGTSYDLQPHSFLASRLQSKIVSLGRLRELLAVAFVEPEGPLIGDQV